MTPSMSPGSWPWSLRACWMAFTCSLPPIAAPPLAVPADDLSDDFMSDDFIVSEGFVSDVPLADGVEVEPLAAGDEVEPLADGDLSVFVSLPVADGELPLLSPLVAPVPAAPLDDEAPELLPDPLGPCASAGAAANAR